MAWIRDLVLTGVLIGSAPPLAGQARFLAPRWSPDGNRLMVVVNLENPRRFDLYAIRLDGSGLVKLREDARDGSWSPDGSRILFTSGSDGDLDIYVMEVSGGAVRQLTNTPEMDYQPVWSPDGKRIAFVSIPPGGAAKHDVHLMNSDGTGRRALTATPEDEQVPSWTADGSGVVFGSTRDGNWEIYHTQADGSGLRRITRDSAMDASPAVSPDGKMVAFLSDRGGTRGIWRLTLNGSAPERLGEQTGSMLSWSPDGRRIAFLGQADGAPGVFVMNADGTVPVRVTPIPAAPVANQRLAPLGWLAGCWELRQGTRVTLEMWMPPADGLMLGASRTTVNGLVREFEQLRLVWRSDTLTYTALPSGQRETAFKGTAVSDSGFMVENPAHDFPQRISYRKRGADSLLARIEGGARTIDFPLKRVSCTPPE